MTRFDHSLKCRKAYTQSLEHPGAMSQKLVAPMAGRCTADALEGMPQNATHPVSRVNEGIESLADRRFIPPTP
jgi:hypothetical protein